MHRTPAPASSLDFFLPPSRSHFQQQSPTYSQTGWPRLDSTLHLSAHAQSASRRAYIGKPSTLLAGQGVAPVYLEAPIRKGLRTPPADEMNAYQPTQHQTYPSRQDTSYPAGAPYTAISAAHQTHPTSNYGRQTSTSNLSNVISSSSQRYSQSRTQSPRDTNKSALAPHDEVVQKKSIIVPNLQIPGSINDSGGSLGEFAAQVRILILFLWNITDFSPDNLFLLVRIDFDSTSSRGRDGQVLTSQAPRSRCSSYSLVSKMGCNDSFDNSSHPERNIACIIIYLPSEDS